MYAIYHLRKFLAQSSHPTQRFFFLFWRAWMEDPFKQFSAWYQIRPKPPSEQTKKCSHFFLYYFILKQEKQRCLKTPCSTQLPGQLLVRFFKGNRFSLKFWPNIGGFRLYQNAFHTLHSTLTLLFFFFFKFLIFNFFLLNAAICTHFVVWFENVIFLPGIHVLW